MDKCRSLYAAMAKLRAGFKADVVNMCVEENAQQRDGYPVEYTLAGEGQLLWTCGYGITSTCRNLDAAHALLNYYLSPQAEAFEAKQWNYMVTNEETLKVVSDEVRKKARLDQAYDLGNALPAAPPAQGYPNWVRAWEDFKRY